MPQALYDFINRLAGVRSDAPEMLKRESARAKRDGVLMGDASGKPDIKTMLKVLGKGGQGLKGVLRMNATQMDLPPGAPTMGDMDPATLVNMAQQFTTGAAGRTYAGLKGAAGQDFLPHGMAGAGGTVSLNDLVQNMLKNATRTKPNGKNWMKPQDRASELDSIVEFMKTFARSEPK